MPDNRDDSSIPAEDGYGASPHGGGSARPRADDPLAELARLIDEDPFADFDRARSASQSRHGYEDTPSDVPGHGETPEVEWETPPEHFVPSGAASSPAEASDAPSRVLADETGPIYRDSDPLLSGGYDAAGNMAEPHSPRGGDLSGDLPFGSDGQLIGEEPVAADGDQSWRDDVPAARETRPADPLDANFWSDPHDDVPDEYATSFDRTVEHERLASDIATAFDDAGMSAENDVQSNIGTPQESSRLHEPAPIVRPDYDPVAVLEAHLLASDTDPRSLDETAHAPSEDPGDHHAWPHIPNEPGQYGGYDASSAQAGGGAFAGPEEGGGAHDRNSEGDSGNADEQYGYADTDPIYGDDGHLMPAHLGSEEPPRNSRRGIFVLASMVGLIVLGGAVALGYRGLGGDPTGEPPLIRADATPPKVAVEVEDDAQANGQGKLVYDRIGGDARESEERLVSREEPVFDVDGRDNEMRVVTPDSASDLRGAADTLRNPSSDEPRRVRTVVVRPDGSIVGPSESDTSVGETTNAATPDRLQIPAAPPRESVASGATVGGEAPAEAAQDGVMAPGSPPDEADARTTALATDSDSGAETAAESDPQPTADATQPQQSFPSQQTAAADQRNTGQPLRITPETSPSGQQASSEAPAQVAQATPGAPPPNAAAAFPSGSFVVQVSSTRSEDEARGTASTLAQRHSGIISGYQTGVERADLGDRGIFYRVGVGPVSSQSDASALCDRLKANGQDCFVRRN